MLFGFLRHLLKRKSVLRSLRIRYPRHIISYIRLGSLKMPKKATYYAVQKGRAPGVYSSWRECKAQVDGFPGACYKKFGSLAESQAFASSSGGYLKACANLNLTTDSGITVDQGHSSHGERHVVSELRGKTALSCFKISKPKSYYSVRSSNSSLHSKIFDNWGDCQRYVKGHKGVSFKKFGNHTEAEKFMNGISNPSLDFEHIGETEEDFISRYEITDKSIKYEKISRVYCDGSALANGTLQSCAGYGVYFQDEPGCDISEPLTTGAQTNNRAELQAVLSCLDKVWKNLTSAGDKKNYQIKTDSEYVAKLLNDRYASISSKQLACIPNSDIISVLIKRFARVKAFYRINKNSFSNDGEFKIEWVKGHAGDEGNEKADQLAKAGAFKNLTEISR